MQINLPRDEILRQVRAMLGIQTDSGLASQVEEQHVAAINAAALKAQQDCLWVNAQQRVTITLQAEQETIAYPIGCGPGSIRAMAVFDENRYYPIEPRIIPVQADQDQFAAAGGDTYKGVQGRPRYFQQRNLIHTWPTSDKQYPVRLDFMADVTMPTGGTVSIIDAQLLIYAGASIISQQSGDPDQAKYYMAMYGDRRNALMAWQSQGTRFAMQTEADLGEDEFLREDLIPNWDRRPTAIPGS